MKKKDNSQEIMISNEFSSKLVIDLEALRDNYRKIVGFVHPATVSVVVKANAYGLGLQKIAEELFSIGCKSFFVANLEEAIELRKILPNSEIHILNGLYKGWGELLLEYDLKPVLNNFQQMDLWLNTAKLVNRPLPADIHIDTGMSRLGFLYEEIDELATKLATNKLIKTDIVLSHLACSSDPKHPANAAQLSKFNKLTKLFYPKRFSLSASSGIFLGKSYHFDLVRPGVAIYGGNPTPGLPNPMKQVIQLKGTIVQTRRISEGQTVGYGATFKANAPKDIAVISIGYSHGVMRSLSNRGTVWIREFEAPILGRISMDLITVDISKIPSELTSTGTCVNLFGAHQTVDQVAKEAGTIDYEVLTGLGQTSNREYVGELLP